MALLSEAAGMLKPGIRDMAEFGRDPSSTRDTSTSDTGGSTPASSIPIEGMPDLNWEEGIANGTIYTTQYDGPGALSSLTPPDPLYVRDPTVPGTTKRDPTEPAPTVPPNKHPDRDHGEPGPTGGGSDPIDSAGTTVQDLYPEGGEVGPVIGATSRTTGRDWTVDDPRGAGVTETDASVTEYDTTAAGGSGGRVSGLLDQGAGGIDAEQTQLTDEQRVDAELARILGQDSPLLAQARAEAARLANSRGLQNSSIATGMSLDAMTKAALPMAQQNAAQAFQREGANTELRQEAGMFTADQQNRLTQLEAELGQQLNIFNAEQLNQAEEIMAQMRTALEQQDAGAYNEASMQLANLQRDAEAQQSELDYRASQAKADAINARNTQIIDSVTRMNEQYLQNMGNADIANIQGTYQQLISTNQAAGSIFNSMMGAMANLMDNPEMTPQQVAEGLASMQDMLKGSLEMISNINDMDFGDLDELIPTGGTSSGTSGGGGGKHPGGKK